MLGELATAYRGGKRRDVAARLPGHWQWCRTGAADVDGSSCRSRLRAMQISILIIGAPCPDHSRAAAELTRRGCSAPAAHLRPPVGGLLHQLVFDGSDDSQRPALELVDVDEAEG